MTKTRCARRSAIVLTRSRFRAPTQIHGDCVGTARSADNLKGGWNRRASK